MRRLVLGALVLAVLVAVGAASPATPSKGVLRAQLRDVLADEERAWALLAKEPPRLETARLVLSRARQGLAELRRSVPAGVEERLHSAQDDDAVASELAKHGVATEARTALSRARTAKVVALGALEEPRAGRPQCDDGRDNDGDGLVDSAFDSGCSAAGDGSERSPGRCTLTLSDGLVSGSCSGPFARIELTLPEHVDAPAADFSAGCAWRSETRLECLMRDGKANPSHRITLRWKTPGRVSADTVRVHDLRGRALTVAPESRPSFQLAAFATYAHGSGKSNVCVFVWTQPAHSSPLRGGVTLSGPGGEQTKAFTTLGGAAKTRVVFTVTERARYAATASLAGKSAQAAATLGLAPTTSGEFACPSP